MDLASILIASGSTALVMFLLVALIGWLLLRRMRAMLAPTATPRVQLTTPTPVVDIDAAPALRVLQDDSDLGCVACAHFNLGAGQRVMATQPAFHIATSHLEPWQMARQRPVKPNPEYEALEGKFLAAQQAGDIEISQLLHDELLALDPGELVDDREDLGQSMMELDWTQLGLCGRHKELRFATDTCPEWSAS